VTLYSFKCPLMSQMICWRFCHKLQHVDIFMSDGGSSVSLVYSLQFISVHFAYVSDVELKTHRLWGVMKINWFHTLFNLHSFIGTWHKDKQPKTNVWWIECLLLCQGYIYSTGSLFAWTGSMMHKKGKKISYIMLQETFVRQKK